VPLFAADKGHIHHRLLARGLSHRATVLTIYAFTVCLGGVAFVLVRAPDHQALVALAVLAGAAIAALRWLGFLDRTRFQELLDARRRNLARREKLSTVVIQLKSAVEPAAVWQSILGAAPAFDVDHVALRAAGRTWKHADSSSRDDMHVALYSLRPERPGHDLIELGWRDGRREVDRDTEIAIEQLCGHVREALARMNGLTANEPREHYSKRAS
jgi:UDP-GlcNAc:undecaprenyl-phosphate GlcNAc-1-phosphate transferase